MDNRYEVKQVTILNTQRTSSVVELFLDQQLVAIELDGAVTNTGFNLEFNTHETSGNKVWNRLKDIGTTTDYNVPVSGAGVYPVKLDNTVCGPQFVRLYGASGNEGADRVINLIFRTLK